MIIYKLIVIVLLLVILQNKPYSVLCISSDSQQFTTIISQQRISLAHFGLETDSKQVNEQTSEICMIVYYTPDSQSSNTEGFDVPQSFQRN